MAELLKRIIIAEIPNVFISDLKIGLRNKGDSINLLAPGINGKPIRSLEQICRSDDLDNLLTRNPPALTLWDENGNQLTGANIERSTNLSTLANSAGTGTFDGDFIGLEDTPSSYENTTSNFSTLVVNSSKDGLIFKRLKESVFYEFAITSFSVKANGGDFNGKYIFEKGYTVSDLIFSWAANETLIGKPSFSPSITLDGDPNASEGSGTLTGINLSDPDSYNYTITLTSVNSNTDTKTSTLYWYYKAYWGFLGSGTSTLANETDIKSLPNNSLSSNIDSSYSDTGTSTSKYFWICIPNTWNQIIKMTDQDTGFALPFIEQSQVSVTNAYSATINYRVYRTSNATFTTSLAIDIN